ncbi:MAG: hypothetical protein ACMXYC_04235, partial [Candidatus Woesearchaeota archaeon]
MAKNYNTAHLIKRHDEYLANLCILYEAQFIETSPQYKPMPPQQFHKAWELYSKPFGFEVPLPYIRDEVFKKGKFIFPGTLERIVEPIASQAQDISQKAA